MVCDLTREHIGAMLEVSIEDYLIARVKELGGVTRKVIYKGRRGAPDRLCILPGGRVVFVEVKRPKGGRHSGQQNEEIALMQSLGAEAYFLKTKEEIDHVFGNVRPRGVGSARND